jgi:hypothetical protein
MRSSDMKTHDLELVPGTDLPVAAVAAHGRLIATSILLTEVLKAVQATLRAQRFSPLGVRMGTSRADESKR